MLLNVLTNVISLNAWQVTILNTDTKKSYRKFQSWFNYRPGISHLTLHCNNENENGLIISKERVTF